MVGKYGGNARSRARISRKTLIFRVSHHTIRTQKSIPTGLRIFVTGRYRASFGGDIRFRRGTTRQGKFSCASSLEEAVAESGNRQTDAGSGCSRHMVFIVALVVFDARLGCDTSMGSRKTAETTSLPEPALEIEAQNSDRPGSFPSDRRTCNCTRYYFPVGFADGNVFDEVPRRTSV